MRNLQPDAIRALGSAYALQGNSKVMSNKSGVLLEEKLKKVRSVVARLPRHLRSVPTCVSIPDAAQRLGIQPSQALKIMKRHRIPIVTIDGVAMISATSFRLVLDRYAHLGSFTYL